MQDRPKDHQQPLRAIDPGLIVEPGAAVPQPGNLGVPALVGGQRKSHGGDLKFWQNRFGISYTYFKNKGEDLLLPVSIPASTGFTALYENAASMQTTGHEVTLDLVIIKSKNWEWDITLNYAGLKNEVLSLAPGIENLFLGGFTDPQIRAVAGQPYRSIYGYDFLRDDAGHVTELIERRKFNDLHLTRDPSK